MMRFDIFTLFPEMLRSPLDESIIARARERGLVEINAWNPRDVTTDRHHIVDDYPYGGGAGMVMKPDPIFTAVERVYESGPIILMSPQGRVFTQAIARELAREPRVTLICGHYEGVDERVRRYLATEEISLGDFVLSGGELAAAMVIDVVARLKEGVLGNSDSALYESFGEDGLLDCPQYTRPAEFRGWKAPEVLLGGNHEEIRQWRRKAAREKTARQRPDLLRM